jgi:hypothetical protein
MNADRRKDIKAIAARLDDVQRARLVLLEFVQGVVDDIDSAMGQEQEAFDNLPESLQEGDRGQQMSAAIEALENAHGTFSDFLNMLEEFDEGQPNEDLDRAME